MILFLISLAFAEPEYQNLKQGEEAGFEGRLLNADALAKMIATYESKVEIAKADATLECEVLTAKAQYDFNVMKAKHDSLEFKHESLMGIKDEHIKLLELSSKPERSMWAFFGGFVVGTAASLTTYYTVKNI